MDARVWGDARGDQKPDIVFGLIENSDNLIVIVSVCGNTMCYLNYREAEVQVLKRT